MKIISYCLWTFFTFIILGSVNADEIQHYKSYRDGISSDAIRVKNEFGDFLYIISSSARFSDCIIKSKINANGKAIYLDAITTIEGAVEIRGRKYLKIDSIDRNKIVITESDVPDYCGLFADVRGKYERITKSSDRIVLTDFFELESLSEITRSILDKTFLYKNSDKSTKTKMYLIKDDKVTVLDEKTDDSGQKWYFINYKGTKDLNMWIKEEAVDIPQAEDLPEQQKTETQTQSKNTESRVVSNTKTTAVEKKTITSDSIQKKEKISKEKTMPSQVQQESSSGGSLPLSLLVPLLGLLAYKLS